ncbi:8-oxo-dGTP diphosphatase [Saccharomonospora amisosensis]|uniref:8-oxo-dGTP diphosphatase n=1 Tax=Saccharomonospora amisosensis TaxID=1128677 RepID=A0A7X5UMG0_9PSEU|nr:NUDIX domain-containing protein [Saccharomonospora amisosensis]NIJ10728.1 8-oxo-dGTP diphosphatase [Saccharomonospora amisosensis]
MEPVVIVGAALVRDHAVLAQQRAYPADMAGRWELPGGRVEPGETEREALRRECVEELGVEVVVHGRLGEDVPLSPGTVLRVFTATLVSASARPRAVEHSALRWVDAAGLAELDWLPADRVLVPELRRLLRTANAR